MLTIRDNPTFSHAVRAQVPVDGGFREERFKATFNVIPAEEAETFNLATGKGTLAFLKRAIVALDELEDADKRPVAYSDAVRDQVLALPYARLALAAAYFEAVSKARAGN